jgi:hypothetical protein
MDWQSIARKAEQLIRRIAPELPACYVLLRSSLPEDRQCMDCLLAFTQPRLDLHYKALLESAGRWHGRGFACVIAEDRCDSERVAVGMVLHEAGHALARAWDYSNAEPLRADQLLFDSLTCAAAVADESKTAPPDCEPFAGHDAAWIRCCAHLTYRARSLGVPLGLADVADTASYGLSPCRDFELALGDEPARCAAMSFRELLATPAPEEFECLWRWNCARWSPNGSARRALLGRVALLNPFGG